MAGVSKFMDPIHIGTYEGLLLYAMKMKRLYTNKLRIRARQVRGNIKQIRELDTICGNFYIQGKIERKMMELVLREISAKGFDVNSVTKEAQKKLNEWMQSYEYAKLVTTVVKSK